MDHDNLSKVDQFKLLTETAAGTPMGTLLRKFWHPIAVGDQLEKGKGSGTARSRRGFDALSRHERATLSHRRALRAPLHGPAHRCDPRRSNSLHVSRLALRRERAVHRHSRGEAAAIATHQDCRLSGPRVLRRGVRLFGRRARPDLRPAAQGNLGRQKGDQPWCTSRSGTATGSSTSKILSMRYMSVSLTSGAASGNSDRW